MEKIKIINVWDSVENSICNSVWNGVRNSVWNSVRNNIKQIIEKRNGNKKR